MTDKAISPLRQRMIEDMTIRVTLKRHDIVEHTHFIHEPRKLPVVLSPEEVARLLDAAPGLKYKAALSVAYGAGLRAAEVISLKVSDIDSKRMIIRVEQGKGGKDRNVMLSPSPLDLLRTWWKAARPQGWLFPGRDPAQPMTTRQLSGLAHRSRHFYCDDPALRLPQLGVSRLLLYPPSNNCTLARRNLHDHRRAQPPQPPRRRRRRSGGRGFRASVARPRARPRADRYDVGRGEQLPQGRAGRGSDRQGWLLDEWHRAPGRRRNSACRAAHPDLGAHDRRAGARAAKSWRHAHRQEREFRLEMPQIIPVFGQPHGHLAYDSGEFKTVFLRPVMRSAKETSLEAHFVLQPV